MDILTIVIVACLIMTAVILLMGVSSMAQGGEYDEKHSEQLMFARVGMQAITLVLLFVALYINNT
jgi:preprotein translocase subunit SecG